jgi:hypothetical protein
LTPTKKKPNSKAAVSLIKAGATLSAIVVAVVASYYSMEAEHERFSRELEHLKSHFEGLNSQFDTHCRVGPSGLPHAESLGVLLNELENRVEVLEKQ